MAYIYEKGYYDGFVSECHGNKAPVSSHDHYLAGYWDGAHDYWRWKDETEPSTGNLAKKLAELWGEVVNCTQNDSL